MSDLEMRIEKLEATVKVLMQVCDLLAHKIQEADTKAHNNKTIWEDV